MKTITVTDLRAELLRVFDGLREGTIESKDAVEVNNTAGKIIASAKLELAHAALRREAPDIPFLRSEKAAIEHAPQKPKLAAKK